MPDLFPEKTCGVPSVVFAISISVLLKNLRKLLINKAYYHHKFSLVMNGKIKKCLSIKEKTNTKHKKNNNFPLKVFLTFRTTAEEILVLGLQLHCKDNHHASIYGDVKI